MKRFVFLLIMIASVTAQAQTTFHPQVRIEYEKVVYVRQHYKEMFSEWYEEFKNMIPEKVVNTYEFLGDTTQSIFKELKEAVLPPNTWYEEVANKNVVYNNYSTLRTITQKPVAEETFLVEDSLLKIQWRLTADTRSIAGYDCRKAIGIVDDTLAIFAFYTDELLIPGGPAKCTWLTGNNTWRWGAEVAYYLVCNQSGSERSQPGNNKTRNKRKKVTRSQLMTQLDAVLKNWGKYGSAMRLNFLL